MWEQGDPLATKTVLQGQKQLDLADTGRLGRSQVLAVSYTLSSQSGCGAGEKGNGGEDSTGGNACLDYCTEGFVRVWWRCGRGSALALPHHVGLAGNGSTYCYFQIQEVLKHF